MLVDPNKKDNDSIIDNLPLKSELAVDIVRIHKMFVETDAPWELEDLADI